MTPCLTPQTAAPSVDENLANAAGEALAAVGGGAVDAIVAACAAREDALLVTDDPNDLRALADGHFRALKLATLTGP
ncbi:MAG: PIN domain-containing protein [Solirubrobacteraceae bacterium]